MDKVLCVQKSKNPRQGGKSTREFLQAQEYRDFIGWSILQKERKERVVQCGDTRWK